MARKTTRRGGTRSGAGRPRTKAPSLPWARIQKEAESGGEEAEIITGLELPEAALEVPAVLDRFRREISVGHARYRLKLRRTINERGQKTNRGAGSVHALGLQARNVLDWDTQVPSQETQPDLATARQRLRDIVERLAVARGVAEGRKVSVTEVIGRLVAGELPRVKREPAVAPAPAGRAKAAKKRSAPKTKAGRDKKRGRGGRR